MSQTVTRQIRLGDRSGLHLRLAAALVMQARTFRAALWLLKSDQKADVRSVLSVLSLGAVCGTELELVGSGEDAEAAVTHLARLLEVPA